MLVKIVIRIANLHNSVMINWLFYIFKKWLECKL